MWNIDVFPGSIPSCRQKQTWIISGPLFFSFSISSTNQHKVFLSWFQFKWVISCHVFESLVHFSHVYFPCCHFDFLACYFLLHSGSALLFLCQYVVLANLPSVSQCFLLYVSFFWTVLDFKSHLCCFGLMDLTRLCKPLKVLTVNKKNWPEWAAASAFRSKSLFLAYKLWHFWSVLLNIRLNQFDFESKCCSICLSQIVGKKKKKKSTRHIKINIGNGSM